MSQRKKIKNQFRLSTDIEELYEDFDQDDINELVELVGGLDEHQSLINKSNIGFSRGSIQSINKVIKQQNIYGLAEIYKGIEYSFSLNEGENDKDLQVTSQDKVWNILNFIVWLVYIPYSLFNRGEGLFMITIYCLLGIPYYGFISTSLLFFCFDEDWEWMDDRKVNLLRWASIIFILILIFLFNYVELFSTMPRIFKFLPFWCSLWTAISPRHISAIVLTLKKRGPIEVYREAYKGWVRGIKFKERII